ncbi:MAG: hypothetical protein ACTSUE_11180 [Promethearchaeota archaeon]
MPENPSPIPREVKLYVILAAVNVFIGLLMLDTGSFFAWIFIIVGILFGAMILLYYADVKFGGPDKE